MSGRLTWEFRLAGTTRLKGGHGSLRGLVPWCRGFRCVFVFISLLVVFWLSGYRLGVLPHGCGVRKSGSEECLHVVAGAGNV